MTHVKKLYRKNKNGKYVFLGHVPDNYPLDENEKIEDICSYCENGEGLINTLKSGQNAFDEGMEVYIEKDKLLAAYSYFPAGYVGPIAKEINFCPMCGRRLTKNEK